MFTRNKISYKIVYIVLEQNVRDCGGGWAETVNEKLRWNMAQRGLQERIARPEGR